MKREIEKKINELECKKKYLLGQADGMANEGHAVEMEGQILLGKADELFRKANNLKIDAEELDGEIKELKQEAEKEIEKERSNPNYINPEWLEQKETLFDFVSEV